MAITRGEALTQSRATCKHMPCSAEKGWKQRQRRTNHQTHDKHERTCCGKQASQPEQPEGINTIRKHRYNAQADGDRKPPGSRTYATQRMYVSTYVCLFYGPLCICAGF